MAAATSGSSVQSDVSRSNSRSAQRSSWRALDELVERGLASRPADRASSERSRADLPRSSTRSIARTLSRRRRWRDSPLNVAARNASEHSSAGSGADDPRAEGQHVHVVVLDALVRRVRVVAHGGPHAADLVRGHARADAGAADEDPAIDLAVADRVPEPLREVRVVVVRVRAVAAEVDELVVRAAPPPRAGGAPPSAPLPRDPPRTRPAPPSAAITSAPGPTPDVRSTPGLAAAERRMVAPAAAAAAP